MQKNFYYKLCLVLLTVVSEISLQLWQIFPNITYCNTYTHSITEKDEKRLIVFLKQTNFHSNKALTRKRVVRAGVPAAQNQANTQAALSKRFLEVNTMKLQQEKDKISAKCDFKIPSVSGFISNQVNT